MVSEEPQSDQIRLIQAVLWLALDLPPREERFARLYEYPEKIQYISEFHGLTNSEVEQIRTAKRTILLGLMEGRLSSSGRPIYSRYTPEYPNLTTADELYGVALGAQHDAAIETIPREFWQPDELDWDRDYCGEVNIIDSDRPTYYIDIRVSYKEITRLKGDPPGDVETPAPTSRRAGRTAKYDQTEFLIYCIHCANVDGLPDRQAEFLKQMDLLLQVLWGPDNVPRETWLKERISQIYQLREKFESGRQRAQCEED